MGQVSVTLNGRTYRLRCGDGEEERLLTVVAHVRGQVDQLIAEHGQIGDDRLVLMAAIMITDELFELRDKQRGIAVASSDPAGEVAIPRHAAPPAMSSAGAPIAAAPRPVHRESAPPPPATAVVSARLPTPMAAPMTSTTPARPLVAGVMPTQGRVPGPTLPASELPTPGMPSAPTAVSSTPPRAIEHLDATALMKGIERKSGRS